MWDCCGIGKECPLGKLGAVSETMSDTPILAVGPTSPRQFSERVKPQGFSSDPKSPCYGKKSCVIERAQIDNVTPPEGWSLKPPKWTLEQGPGASGIEAYEPSRMCGAGSVCKELTGSKSSEQVRGSDTHRPGVITNEVDSVIKIQHEQQAQ
uniref:Uncharacterized protein n=1 Tax=Pristionchus pacificus TaxID=54126 RepID=A0A2A6B364_PRIPA|eukprot:PDM60314.1 hypothetical protein PRIPAC_54139 [Pristionchus pacificus]